MATIRCTVHSSGSSVNRTSCFSHYWRGSHQHKPGPYSFCCPNVHKYSLGRRDYKFFSHKLTRKVESNVRDQQNTIKLEDGRLFGPLEEGSGWFDDTCLFQPIVLEPMDSKNGEIYPWRMYYYGRNSDTWQDGAAPALITTGSIGMAVSDDGICWKRFHGHLKEKAIFTPRELGTDTHVFDELHVGCGDVIVLEKSSESANQPKETELSRTMGDNSLPANGTSEDYLSKRSPPTPSPHRQSKYAKMKLRVLVTGGAGFIGSHLVDRLMEAGHSVIVVDNFFTGAKENLKRWMNHPDFEIMRHDVTEPLLVEVDQIYHLACPASPIFYKHNPVKTIKTNVMGTLNMLGLAKRVGARILLTSTSEVYGDPLVHPQTEDYWGNVNPIGVRSCYDEGKRVAETLMFDYHRQHGLEIRVARIFNTYGPRMNIDDGRVVSNFIAQAIRGEELTVQAPGTQTRSFCYVSDLVDGLIRLMEGSDTGPINLGNPGEFTMLELAEAVRDIIEPKAAWKMVDNTPDDPKQRKPDITKAKQLLGWEPKISLREGLPKMAEDFRERLSPSL